MPLWRTFISGSLPFALAALLIELMVLFPICQGSILKSIQTIASCSSLVSWMTALPRSVRVPLYRFWYLAMIERNWKK